MNWLMIIQLIPLILQLMEYAEKAFSNQHKAGEQKKEAVTGILQAVVTGMATISTGGQKETWVNLAPVINIIIDGACRLMFPHEEQ